MEHENTRLVLSPGKRDSTTIHVSPKRDSAMIEISPNGLRKSNFGLNHESKPSIRINSIDPRIKTGSPEVKVNISNPDVVSFNNSASKKSPEIRRGYDNYSPERSKIQFLSPAKQNLANKVSKQEQCNFTIELCPECQEGKNGMPYT